MSARGSIRIPWRLIAVGHRTATPDWRDYAAAMNRIPSRSCHQAIDESPRVSISTGRWIRARTAKRTGRESIKAIVTVDEAAA
jgi:hypothetical protein